MGWMKKPRLDLGPKLNKPIAHPQAMTTSGVRQPTLLEAGPSSPEAVDMQIPPIVGRALANLR
jgi:hypothetical protein